MTGTTVALAILVKLTRQWLGSGKAPGSLECAAQRRLSDSFQAHVRAASASPRAGTGIENTWLGFDEHLLFEWRDFDHGPAIVRITKGRKDFSLDAKIGVMHVSALFRFGKAKGQTPKLAGGHRVASIDGDSTSTNGRQA